jgi:tryptophan-rich sensory protein
VLLAALPVVAAAAIGNRATLPAIPEWYAGLVKPSFNPPNGVFGPVWTLLYLAMILAFARVLRRPAATPGRNTAIGLFLAQLVLNAAWSVVFFGLRSPGAAIGVVLALDLAVVATIRAFGRLDRPAAFWLVPYLAWIAFATVLNVAVWHLNG